MEHYESWMERLEKEGFDPFLLTFKFRHIPGSPLSVQKAMREEVERVYGASLTRIFRRPNSAANRPRQPRWIACPDYPVGKGVKSSLRDVTINGGRHVHAIAMVPHESRLQERFDLHLLANNATYVRAPLLDLQAEPVRSRLGYVTGYGMKQLGQGRVDSDQIIILPRTLCEMPSRSDRRMDRLLDA